MICKICNKECNEIGKHLRNNHKNISTKNYYDLYLRKNNEGFCLVCKKPTRFVNAVIGYREYCSVNCSNSSEKTKKKYIETCLRKYGVKNSSQSKEILEKIKKSFFKKYGTFNLFNNKDIKEKIKRTNKIRYGYYYPSQSDIIKNKIRETNLRRFKKESYLQTNYCKFERNRIKAKKLLNKINNIANKKLLFLLNYNKKYLKFKCLKCNSCFIIQRQLFWKRFNKNKIICNICNPYQKPISNPEKELLSFIEENYNKEIITNSKQIILSYELDIYLPDLKLAFEYNGLYWHSELNKPKDYHLIKTELCEKQGIHLIHIYEDDWLYKQNIVKSMILNLLNKYKIIDGKKCDLKNVSFNEIKNFLNNNHIQGYCNSNINLGLYYDNELVTVMTFNKLIKENYYELLRFCNKLSINVIDGFNILFNYFKEKFNPEYIVSYADRNWIMNSNDNIYNKLGFKYIKNTEPNHSYIVDGIRKNKYLLKDNLNYKNILNKDIYKIYDSGSLEYVFIKNC